MKSYKPSPCTGHVWRKSPGRDALYCSEPRCQTEISAIDFLGLMEHEFSGLVGFKSPKEV